MKYRKKPVEVEAIRWIGDPDDNENLSAVSALGNAITRVLEVYKDGRLDIQTLEGVMTASPGDYIIKGVKGEIYPCKPDIFAASYSPVPADDQTVPGAAIAGTLRGLLGGGWGSHSGPLANSISVVLNFSCNTYSSELHPSTDAPDASD